MNDMTSVTQSALDRLARIDVADLILRERLSRDNMAWEEMASYYHPQSVVDVSWVLGSGAHFVELSRKAAGTAPLNFHVMTPPIVNVEGSRAISETPCTLRSFSKFGDVEASYEGFVRLFWRAKRDGAKWLIFGLRALYVTDLFHGRNPSKPPQFDDGKLATYRTSYRYMVANLAAAGIEVRENLPGIDRPEVVASMRMTEWKWLAELD